MIDIRKQINHRLCSLGENVKNTHISDLTTSDVQGWVEAAMGEQEVTNMKTGLDAQIDELINPVVQTKTIG